MTDAPEATDPITIAVNAATEPETFNVFDFVAETNTPGDTVSVYTNGAAAVELSALFEKEKAALEKSKKSKKDKADALSIADEEELPIDEERVTELTAQLEASKLTFNLKGLAPKAVDALRKHLQATLPYKEGAENEEYSAAFNNEILVRTIESVTNSSGAVQQKPFTADNIDSFLTSLYPDQSLKLQNAIWKTVVIGEAFDQAVSANFS